MDGCHETWNENVIAAFEEFNWNPDELVGYTEITGLLVFDINLDKN